MHLVQDEFTQCSLLRMSRDITSRLAHQDSREAGATPPRKPQSKQLCPAAQLPYEQTPFQQHLTWTEL